MADTVGGGTVQTIATSKYAEKKGYRVAPSPGYIPGHGSPLRERPLPPPPVNPADGPAIVREMIQDTLEDLEDHEEWKLHCSGVTMWSFMSAIIGMFMILMSRAITPLFYSLKPNDILFAFGLLFQLPLIRLMIILCMPRKDERKRRKVIRVKKKERKKGDLHGTRFQVMEDMYANRLTPQVTEHTIYYNQSDNVSVLTNPTMVVAGKNLSKFQDVKKSMNGSNLNDIVHKEIRPQTGQSWVGASDV